MTCSQSSRASMGLVKDNLPSSIERPDLRRICMNGYIVDEPRITSTISAFDLHCRMSTILPSIEKSHLNIRRKIDGVAVFASEFSSNATKAHNPTSPSAEL